MSNTNDLCKMSFLKLRKSIGILGFSLPIIIFLMVGYQDSISFTYYLKTHDVFEGALWLIAGFFICDKGYDRWDTIANIVCGVCAWCVAYFPCESPLKVIHFVSAFLLFTTLGLISMFLFTKGDSGTDMKMKRNVLYEACGATILFNVVLIGLFCIIGKPIFIPESICLFAFGISWLVKGETFLTDK